MPKNFHKVGLANRGIRSLGNSSHDGCLKTKKKNDLLKKNKNLMIIFERK